MKKLPPLKSLQAFEAAARLNSFAKAADELNLTPSAISHQIRFLEERLGLILFHRVHKGVELTEIGEKYSAELITIFAALNKATDKILEDTKSNILTIHCVPSLAYQWLMPRLKKFNALNPEIDVRLQAAVEAVDLVTQDIDLAIRYGENKSDANVAYWPFPQEPLAVLCSPKIQKSKHPLLSPSDVTKQTIIHSEINILKWQHWNNLYPQFTLDLSRGPRFDRSFMSIKMAKDAEGIALESLLLAQNEIAANKLILPFGMYKTHTTFHYLQFMKKNENLPKIKKFRNWLEKELKESFNYFDQFPVNECEF